MPDQATYAPTIVVLEPALFFMPRFVDVISAAGATPIVVETPDEFVAAVDRHFPVVAFVDLATSGDWFAAIQRCKLRPHTRSISIFAFGSHVDAATLQAARRAGADHAWARSRFMTELPAVVAQHVTPAVVYPVGWDAPLSELARQGIEAFNHADYFEQHEYLEAAWLAEPRPVRAMYQGILQVGVAFLQIQRHNWPGALKLLRRGLPRLRTLPPVCQGVEIAAFRAAAESIHAEVTALGPQRLGEFDQARFPKIGMNRADGEESPAFR